jgi:AraC-like DNA-binding protein
LHLSANYFGDLLKKETRKTAQEHIHEKLIDIAKEKIFNPTKSVSEVAYELGFKYPPNILHVSFSWLSIRKILSQSSRSKFHFAIGSILSICGLSFFA